MTPEEKFNEEVWWVLQKIRTEELRTRRDEPIEWVMQARPLIGAGIPPIGVRQKILLKLEEWGAIRIIEQDTQDTTYGKDFIYTFELIHQKFNDLYKVYQEVNEPKRPHLQPVDITPTAPFHQPTMREIMEDAERGMQEVRKQSFEERLLRKSFKQQRILSAKEDKYTHALNTIAEWAEYYGDGKSFPLDYHYFNFEDRMDDSKMFERFLDKLKEAGCFKDWKRTNYTGGTRFGFLEVSLEKLRVYARDSKTSQDNSPREERQPNELIKPQGGKPFTEVKGGKGYLKFYKQGPSIEIGGYETRTFRLLQCLCEPFGVQKIIEAVFEAIKLPKDIKDSRLLNYGPQKHTRMVEIIEYTIKELQKKKELKKIRYKFDGPKQTMWLELEG